MLMCPGSNQRNISRELAELLDIDILNTNISTFPDGEVYLRIEDYEKVPGETIVVIQSLYAPQERNLFTLLNLSETLKELGAREVWAVIPYLCYSRADRVVLPGEAISAKTVLKLMEASMISKLFVVDVHNEAIFKFTDIVAKNVYPSKDYAQFLKEQGVSPDLIVAPDEGAKLRAQLLANEFGIPSVAMKKIRDPYTGEVQTSLGEFNQGADEVVIVDDIVSTGGSIAEASRMLRAQGVKKVHVIVSHVIGERAPERLHSMANGVVAASTSIPSSISVINITKSLAEALVAFGE